MSRENFALRRENLVNIMKAGSETGMLLFSQPASFRWQWSVAEAAERSGRLRIALLPGLEKVRDQNASELRGVQEMVKPVFGTVVG